jgi:hypothetical protein
MNSDELIGLIIVPAGAVAGVAILALIVKAAVKAYVWLWALI